LPDLSAEAAEAPRRLGLTGYLAAEGYLDQLRHELGEPPAIEHGRLLFAPGPPKPLAWAANVWRDPVEIPIRSIKHGASKLRAIQRNWVLYSHAHHRRAALIAAELPSVSAKKLVFPSLPPRAPLGSWTLLNERMIIAAADCSSPFPNGEARFVEDREGPPNRAYLKLWEALTLAGRWPQPGETCLDLGASPGGWTYALARLGARVISVDKAALDPKVAALPNVEVRRDSAFALEPADVGPVDWLFSDVVCYPDRLHTLLAKWLASGLCRHAVCTVKFQAPTDFAAQAKFAALPGRLVHLHHNKHELTWIALDLAPAGG
jgi:23S rRNA (cytidine2498-2'-O)-methyltransferase